MFESISVDMHSENINKPFVSISHNTCVSDYVSTFHSSTFSSNFSLINHDNCIMLS